MFCYYTIGFFLWTYPCHSALYSPLRLQVHWRIAGALCLTILRTCRGYCMHVLYCFVPKVLEKFYRTYINFSTHVPNHHDDPGNFPLVQVHMAPWVSKVPFSIPSWIKRQKILWYPMALKNKHHCFRIRSHGTKQDTCTANAYRSKGDGGKPKPWSRGVTQHGDTAIAWSHPNIRKKSPIFDQNAMETPLSRGSQSYVQIQRFHTDTTSRSSFCRCFKQVEVSYSI